MVLLGRLHGVPTPVIARLQEIANRFGREHRPPASLSAGGLRAFVASAQA